MCRPKQKLPWKKSVYVLFMSWKKMWSLCCVYFWETGPLSYFNCPTERLTVRIGSTFTWNLPKWFSLFYSLSASDMSCFHCQWSSCEDTFVCVCLHSVNTGLRHPSAGFPLALHIPPSASYSIMFPPSCGCFHGSLKRCKYTAGESTD